jgi:long-chain fatty acid transport protein
LIISLYVLAGCTSTALSQGYGLYEQSAYAAGRGGAGVAAPCADGSGIFFNPAGLAFDPGTLLSAGGSVIAPRGTFTADGNQGESRLRDRNYLAPAVYYQRGLGSRAALGVGLFAPYGLTTDWPVESQGRFIGYKGLLQSLFVRPTAAWRVREGVTLGAGVDITYVKVQLRRRVDLSRRRCRAQLA